MEPFEAEREYCHPNDGEVSMLLWIFVGVAVLACAALLVASGGA